MTRPAALVSEGRSELDGLAELIERDDPADRAFADAMIRFRFSRARDEGVREALSELHEALRAAALASHSALRARIASGALRGAELRRLFDAIAPLERDHFVEEVLGIAYPPLEEAELSPELIAYTPSGYREIVRALDATGLGPDGAFLDVGSGAGKAVMLAALLTGATSTGVERDAALHALAVSNAAALRVERASFVCGDAREAALGDADVVFMYLPFTGRALERVIERLSRARGRRYLCAGTLDLGRHPELVLEGSPGPWLRIYRWR